MKDRKSLTGLSTLLVTKIVSFNKMSNLDFNQGVMAWLWCWLAVSWDDFTGAGSLHDYAAKRLPCISWIMICPLCIVCRVNIERCGQGRWTSASVTAHHHPTFWDWGASLSKNRPMWLTSSRLEIKKMGLQAQWFVISNYWPVCAYEVLKLPVTSMLKVREKSPVTLVGVGNPYKVKPPSS